MKVSRRTKSCFRILMFLLVYFVVLGLKELRMLEANNSPLIWDLIVHDCIGPRMGQWYFNAGTFEA